MDYIKYVFNFLTELDERTSLNLMAFVGLLAGYFKPMMEIVKGYWEKL